MYWAGSQAGNNILLKKFHREKFIKGPVYKDVCSSGNSRYVESPSDEQEFAKTFPSPDMQGQGEESVMGAQ